MSPNDQSFLSAYVDGELDPDEQRAVESALAADPHLAETVQGLLRVRDQVAELPRPLPPDLSTQVMRRIHAPRAACPSVELGATIRPLEPRGNRGGNRPAAHLAPSPRPRQARTRPAHRPKRLQEPRRRTPSELASIETARRQSPSGPTRRIAGPPWAPSPDRLTRAPPRDAGQCGRCDSTRHASAHFLNDKHLQRVFLVTDRIGEPAEQQVISLVERTTHHDFYKITVSQGIVIDPRHPGKATVFAVVLDPSELDPFRQHLKDTFKDRLEDNEIDPAVAMQLVDIGQVVSLPAHPIAEVTIPSSTMALRARARGVPDADLNALPPPDSEPARPTPEQERSSPAAELAQDGQNQARDPGIADGCRAGGRKRKWQAWLFTARECPPNSTGNFQSRVWSRPRWRPVRARGPRPDGGGPRHGPSPRGPGLDLRTGFGIARRPVSRAEAREGWAGGSGAQGPGSRRREDAPRAARGRTGDRQDVLHRARIRVGDQGRIRGPARPDRDAGRGSRLRRRSPVR